MGIILFFVFGGIISIGFSALLFCIGLNTSNFSNQNKLSEEEYRLRYMLPGVIMLGVGLLYAPLFLIVYPGCFFVGYGVAHNWTAEQRRKALLVGLSVLVLSVIIAIVAFMVIMSQASRYY